nr:unnamed protein product [Callosobruchus analis]
MRKRNLPDHLREILGLSYKQAKKKLRQAIKASKLRCWRKLIAEVDEDIWRKGYRIVFSTLRAQKPRSGVGQSAANVRGENAILFSAFSKFCHICIFLQIHVLLEASFLLDTLLTHCDKQFRCKFRTKLQLFSTIEMLPTPTYNSNNNLNEKGKPALWAMRSDLCMNKQLAQPVVRVLRLI